MCRGEAEGAHHLSVSSSSSYPLSINLKWLYSLRDSDSRKKNKQQIGPFHPLLVDITAEISKMFFILSFASYADHWDGVYVLPLPKSEGRAVLGEREGGNPLPSPHILLHSFPFFPFLSSSIEDLILINKGWEKKHTTRYIGVIKALKLPLWPNLQDGEAATRKHF